jgi:hypothetical protein
MASSTAEQVAPTAASSGFWRNSVSPEMGSSLVTGAERYELAESSPLRGSSFTAR